MKERERDIGENIKYINYLFILLSSNIMTITLLTLYLIFK